MVQCFLTRSLFVQALNPICGTVSYCLDKDFYFPILIFARNHLATDSLVLTTLRRSLTAPALYLSVAVVFYIVALLDKCQKHY